MVKLRRVSEALILGSLINYTLQEIADTQKKRIYIVNDNGEILSIRDFRGNILDRKGNYLEAIESDIYKQWRAKFNSDLEK